MAKAKKKPTIRRLLKLLETTPIKIVKRATLGGQLVSGYCNDDGIFVGLQGNRNWSKADSVVLTVIHELVHEDDERHSESEARMWEAEFLKSAKLREAVMVRVLNVVL